MILSRAAIDINTNNFPIDSLGEICSEIAVKPLNIEESTQFLISQLYAIPNYQEVMDDKTLNDFLKPHKRNIILCLGLPKYLTALATHMLKKADSFNIIDLEPQLKALAEE